MLHSELDLAELKADLVDQQEAILHSLNWTLRN